MDSRLAADPIARQILDLLTVLEKAAGVRAHYRILESPPLVSMDLSSMQTVARVLSDWIGLRNATFDIMIVEHEQPARLLRIDPDREEFVMELPASVLTTPDCAMAVVARQVARAYLVTSNIGGSSTEPARTAGSFADVTAVFLGMGKLLLNAPAAGVLSSASAAPDVENQPLSAQYLAFTHRIVCSMRGLDWNQHTSALTPQAIQMLRQWDTYRDTVFSQALRNVLTASASHRPLMDAVEDNHLALARFDQLQRVFEHTVLRPLEQEMQKYHQTCREGMERLAAREQDTYDPCLLYLNQLRRRMDLQRYADMLLLQQDHVIRRLRVLTAGLGDLGARQLVHPEGAAGQMHSTHCPFDATEILIHDQNQDSRVRCPTCGYTFLATSGLPQIPALQAPPEEAAYPEDATTSAEMSPKKSRKTAPAKMAKGDTHLSPSADEPPVKQKKSGGAGLIITGFVLMPASWIPMLGYVFIQLLRGQETPLIDMLGRIGVYGSIAAVGLIALGALIGLMRWTSRKRNKDVPVSATPSDAAAPVASAAAPSAAPASATDVESAEPVAEKV